MTRYTRGKGTKAANERLPNEGTPWNIMKQQLEEALQKEHVPQETTKSARQLLKENNDLYYPQSLGNCNTDWAEFDNSKTKTKTVKSGKVEKKPKVQQKTLKSVVKTFSGHNGLIETTSATNLAEKIKNNKSDINQRQTNKNNVEDNYAKDHNNLKEKKVEKQNNSLNKKQLNNRKRKQKAVNESKRASEDTSNNEEQINDNEPEVSNGKLSKRQKRNKKKTAQTNDKQTLVKNKEDRDYQRRKPDDHVTKITINGMDVEIVKYDGFPVKKEDAERLKELRQQMVLKGIPKSEIDTAMKLERRRCEKNLARLKKQVCFHCRKAGHNLSDCPELGKEEAGTGICFKCGSTEHTHFECKVTKSDDYRYAKCFICREQGHIAKQCPDNPKGLYPDGGCCKICGDVTHLKRDCPDLTKEKEETTLTLDTLNSSNMEGLNGSAVTKPLEKRTVRKIVKF